MRLDPAQVQPCELIRRTTLAVIGLTPLSRPRPSPAKPKLYSVVP